MIDKKDEHKWFHCDHCRSTYLMPEESIAKFLCIDCGRHTPVDSIVERARQLLKFNFGPNGEYISGE